MRHIGIFLVVLVGSVIDFRPLCAQDYLITTKGDSISGQLKPLLYGPEKKVQVAGPDKKKQVYSIFQVRRYRYDNEMYEPVKGPDGFTFMKLVKSGYLSLYNYQLPNQVTFEGSYLQRRDGRGMDVPNISFKKAMRNFLKDCPEVSNRIEQGDLGRKQLNEIIDAYNVCIDKNTAHAEVVAAAQNDHVKTITSWDDLESKVKTAPDFEGKPNALEMIQDIKGKIGRSEKIPNFLIEGLKTVLKDESLQTALNTALKDLKN